MNEACAGMGDVLVEVEAVDSGEFLVDITVSGVISVMDVRTARDLAHLIQVALQLAGVDVEDE